MENYFLLLLFCFFFFFFINNNGFGFADDPVIRAVPNSNNNSTTSPYLISQSLFFLNYQRMLDNFKIFAYKQPNPSISDPAISLFHFSLPKSPFLTTNGDEAHLFYFSFSANLSTRATARLIRDLRSDHPYWNRSLGADHFYVSSGGVGYESDRNMVELKKNSVQISCFPAKEGKFIPHKDITLPTLSRPSRRPSPVLKKRVNESNGAKFLFIVKGAGKDGQVKAGFASTFLKELSGDPDFLLVQSETIGDDDDAQQEEEEKEESADEKRLLRFCLFLHGESDLVEIGEALRHGCVPVIASDRPILELPFMDVLKWSEMAVFVGAKGGVKEIKKRVLLLDGTQKYQYERMRELGKMASKHFVWNASPQPYDAFYTVLYQLWLRRHIIRYAQRTSI